MKKSLRNWQNRQRHLSFWLATGFGSGLLKPAPGSWGSLAALISGFYLLIYPSVWLLLGVGYLALSLWAIRDIEKKTDIHDAGEIVADEIIGQWIAMVPFLFFAERPSSDLSFYGFLAFYGFLVLSFLFFRFFDIVKPGPIGWIDDHVGGAWGVMADDLAAGLLAALCLSITMLLSI